jgi:GAF domain-containing protein
VSQSRQALWLNGLPLLRRWRKGRRPAEPATRPTGAVAAAYAKSDDAGSVARGLLAQVEAAVGVELACLVLVDTAGRTASGLVGRVRERELDWFPDVRIDLDNEPSGVATAAFEAAPFAVYDAQASRVVSRRLVDATGAKSVAFVPLISHERVIAVLVVGMVTQPRAFDSEELALLQRIAGEAVLAIDRSRSALALA